jgi:hypothetical protein
MKKIVIILLFAFVGLGLNAQSTLRNLPGFTITDDLWSYDKTYSDTSFSINSYRDSVAFAIYDNKQDSSRNVIGLKISEVTSPARVITQWQVRRSIHDSWTNMYAITYTGVGTDSTILMTSQAPYKSWPYNRVLLIYAANKAKLAYIWMTTKK